MRGTNAAFRFLAFCFVSCIVTELVLYLLDLLLQYDLQSQISYPFNDRFITSIDIVAAIYLTFMFIVSMLRMYSSIRNEKTGQRFFFGISFSVLFVVFFPILLSYFITGYVSLSSVIMSFLLCMYTVIAMILSRITIGRPFKSNPNKFKQGKSNLIYYEYTELFM